MMILTMLSDVARVFLLLSVFWKAGGFFLVLVVELLAVAVFSISIAVSVPISFLIFHISENCLARSDISGYKTHRSYKAYFNQEAKLDGLYSQ